MQVLSIVFHNCTVLNIFILLRAIQLTGLEKIIRFGNVVQAQNVQHSNTLFGGSSSGYEVQSPKIANCEQWSLTELLDHEKEVTGMFMSGHPLDHFKFEINHYGISQSC